MPAILQPNVNRRGYALERFSKATGLLLVAVCACGGGGSGAAPKNAKAKTTAQAINAAAKGGTAPPGDTVAPDAVQDSVPPKPVVRVSGYVVRGTDEASFLPCGSGRVHFLRLAPRATFQVNEAYRFRSAGMLQPTYFVFRARLLDDTVTHGGHRYRAIAEVAGVEPVTGAPDCAPPRAGSLIGRQ
jgi:hypothetical protein